MAPLPVRKERVTPELAGPLDRAIRGLFRVSWGKARAWIAAGKVRVGGEVVTTETARAAAGVELVVDERARAAARGTTSAHGPPYAGGRKGSAASVQVVHADPHVVVVAKPAGISTVPYEGSASAMESAREGVREDTLEARVRAWIEAQGGRRRAGRPNLGVVHRLDKETTGLIVFTRTWLAKQSLSSQFRQHTVHRRYLAIAHGDIPRKTIRTFLLADRGDGLRGSARHRARENAPAAARSMPPLHAGREAITHVEPVQALRGATLVACRLETGRTHQIRIHLSETGHPLVGERVYVRGYAGPLIEAPRLMLHAAELGFVHPATGRPMQWELPLPDDMVTVMARLAT
jgi:23S rRNA pseudouridine1911/1915/1917 synthase